MLEGDKSYAQEYEDHRLRQVCQGVDCDLDHFATMLGDVVSRVSIQHNTIDKDGDDTGELEGISNQIADPRAQQDDADLRVEVLFVGMFLLTPIQLLFRFLLIIFLVIDGGLTF